MKVSHVWLVVARLSWFFKYDSLLSAYMNLYDIWAWWVYSFYFYFFNCPLCMLSHNVNGNEVSEQLERLVATSVWKDIHDTTTTPILQTKIDLNALYWRVGLKQCYVPALCCASSNWAQKMVLDLFCQWNNYLVGCIWSVDPAPPCLEVVISW